MKTLLLLLFLFLSLTLNAQQVITATVTVTNANGTTNGQTITINGTVRTFTNNITSANIQVQTATNIPLATSNLFVDYAGFPQANVILTKLSTNIVTFQCYPGTGLSAAISTNWATLSFATNTIGTNTAVMRAPFSIAGPTERTNVASAIAAYLSDPSCTNVVPTNAPALSLFVPSAASTFQSASNYTFQVATNATNFTLQIGANDSNYTAQSFAQLTGKAAILLNESNNNGASSAFLNTFTMPARTMTNNGDVLTREIGIAFDSGGGTNTLSLYFYSFGIFTNAIVTTNSGAVTISCRLVRTGNAKAAYAVTSVCNRSSTNAVAVGAISSGIDYTDNIAFQVLATSYSSTYIRQIYDTVRLWPTNSWPGF